MTARSVALGDVAQFVRGVTFKPEDVTTDDGGDAIACMRTSNVQRNLDTSDVWRIPRAMVKRPDQMLQTGDILVSSANSWNLVGKCCWVPELPGPTTFGGFVSVLRVDQTELDPRYAYWWFSSPHMQQVVRSLGRRTTSISNLDLARCLRVNLSIPPLEEQRRIVRILDQADQLRLMRQASSDVADSLRLALFDDTFGGSHQTPVTVGDRLEPHPRGWRWELLGDVAQLATGHTPDRKKPEYWSGDVPWITLTDIRALDGRTAKNTSEAITEEGLANSSAVKLPPQTVCFSRTASLGFVTITGRAMATSQDFVNWVCSERLSPTYLMHALIRSRERLRGLSTGSTHKTIYFPTVQRFRVLVPPLAEQERFTSRIRAADVLRDRTSDHLRELNSLFASLQHRAFTGEL
jgi:type I restriction enzyme S subunit